MKITDHNLAAKKRLLYQFKEKVRIEGLVDSFTDQIQEIENAIWELIDGRAVTGSAGYQLDRLGDFLGVPRFGLSDEDYRIQIVAKIGQNTSEGTAEDLISIFTTLARPRYIIYAENYPAEVSITAVDADPIGNVLRIRAAIEKAKPAGVDITSAIVSARNVFSFDLDTDPFANGFGDANNATLGGEWAAII
jgi:hypothetical protein